MAESDWRKPIELYIDQQVFIDAVEGGESVQELSALTEVDSFEQRGEELYLEGHILFTAFLGLHESEAGGPGAIRQAQYRMPFDLSVPVAAQVPGTLNVTVEVPEAALDVLGPGWTHIRAVMKVDGLAGDGGYTVHCGAQEAEVAAARKSAEPDANVEGGQESEQETEPELAFAARQEAEESSPAQNWKTQLEEADRALSGAFSPFRTGQPPAEPDAADVRQDDALIASFHYEGLDLNTPFATPDSPGDEEQAENTRRDWDDVLFTPEVADYPVPAFSTQPVAPEDAVAPAEADESAPPEPAVVSETTRVQTSYTAVPESPVEMSAAQWFWKTLNVPDGETVATMKFRIVQEDETLDGIAQMYRLTVTELLRANRRTGEAAVAAGDLLYIPGRT